MDGSSGGFGMLGSVGGVGSDELLESAGGTGSPVLGSDGGASLSVPSGGICAATNAARASRKNRSENFMVTLVATR